MARTPYIRHLKHRKLERVRHSSRLLAWLQEQADRLSKTVAEVFALLAAGMTATAVEDMEPEPPDPGDWPPAADGDWSTGAGTIVATVGEEDVEASAESTVHRWGYSANELNPVTGGSVENGTIGTSSIYELYISDYRDVTPADSEVLSGKIALMVNFTGNGEGDEFMAAPELIGRTVTVQLNDATLWSGILDGSTPEGMESFGGYASSALVLLEEMPEIAIGDNIAVLVEAP